MPTWPDAQGQPMVAASRESATRFDLAVDAYLGARGDTPGRLAALLEDDPACVMGHCLDGYLQLLSSKRPGIGRAAEALRRAEAAASSTVTITARERSHLGALDAWASGDMRDAVQCWDAALAAGARDLVALKVSQFVLSYLGESERMRETVARVLPSWQAGVPGYGFVLGCHAYALEETGDYAHAEAQGRRAVELNPADIWAAHAVAHVTEMQGRLHDGVTWISSVAGHWGECNNFRFHLRWHEALFQLDLERHARVLELYDHDIRPESSDEYLDVSNAVSLLWRLEQAGVDVGPRWRELADRARGHIDDHALVFADLHYLMALASVSDADAVARFLGSCEAFAATGRGTQAAVMAEVGLSLARAVVAHRRGLYDDVVELVVPVFRQIRRIGGSHAQRDLFDQMLIDAAIRGRRFDVAAGLLAERTARRPHNMWAWKAYAATLDALGAGGAAAAHRRLEQLRTD
jgi:tetratricopeptide (TPR) repeat protein